MIDLSGITALPGLLGRVGTIQSSILQLGAPAGLAGDPSGIRHLEAKIPLYQVSKGCVGKGGIVRDPELHRAACEKVTRAVREFGFNTSIMDSPKVRGTNRKW